MAAAVPEQRHGARVPAGRSRLQRLVAVDHPDRSSTFDARPVRAAFLRVDHTHELPLVATDESGHELARFRRLADLADFLRIDGLPATVPASIAREARASHVGSDPLWSTS